MLFVNLICLVVFLSNFFLSSSPSESLALLENCTGFTAQGPPPNASFASLQLFCQEARRLLPELSPTECFNYGVSTETVVPIKELKVIQFEGGDTFYCNAEGYVQVYTQGETRNRIDSSDNASIGV